MCCVFFATVKLFGLIIIKMPKGSQQQKLELELLISASTNSFGSLGGETSLSNFDSPMLLLWFAHGHTLKARDHGT